MPDVTAALPDLADTPLAGVVATEPPSTDAAWSRLLHGLPGVDEVGARARVARLATRSIKRESKQAALDLAIRCTDLTTLEGADTPGKVRAMSAKAVRPDAADPSVPSVAAVCVYPDLVPEAVAATAASSVAVASVATAFPAGRARLDVKLADTRAAVADGAHEIDMVIDRGAFLAGRYGHVAEEIREVKAACGDAHLKVILETGELATLDHVRQASWLAILCGADFIKTSTGKVSPAASREAVLVMLEAVRDVAAAGGRIVGVKAAGGIRTAKDAIRYLVLVHEVVGPAWLDPSRWRFGASSLLNDLLLQRQWLRTGAYADPDAFSID